MFQDGLRAHYPLTPSSLVQPLLTLLKVSSSFLLKTKTDSTLSVLMEFWASCQSPILKQTNEEMKFLEPQTCWCKSCTMTSLSVTICSVSTFQTSLTLVIVANYGSEVMILNLSGSLTAFQAILTPKLKVSSTGFLWQRDLGTGKWSSANLPILTLIHRSKQSIHMEVN